METRVCMSVCVYMCACVCARACMCFAMLTRDFTRTVGTSDYFTARFFFWFLFGLWTLLLNFTVKTCVSGEGRMEVTFGVKESCKGPTKIA